MKTYRFTYDVAVLGAGPAGLAAAITASRNGAKVLLVEKNGYLGGTLASGISPLGFLDEDGRQCIGGFGQEIIDRLKSESACLGHRVCPKHNSVTCLHSESVKLLAIDLCKESGVDVLLHCETTEVLVEKGIIKNVKLNGKCNEINIDAKVYIDCTGDGDVAYLAGCSYTKGKDNNGMLQPPTVVFTLENVHIDTLFDYVEAHPEELKINKNMSVKQGYDAAYFKGSKNFCFVGMTNLFNKLREKGELPVQRENLIIIGSPNPGEVYINTSRILDIDATDILDLTRAELEGQRQVGELYTLFKKYVPGFEDCFISSICPNLGVRGDTYL